ncbi:hypothetical protein, partial [Neisseria sp. HMSC072B12]|uniref:hypothetical protein n=1 Tax=Neisseria sp. HMSC072B12 TaxID=1715080 RepID=UPI001AEFCC92
MAEFQHTAARRRLDAPADEVFEALVSTHSRPKAAVQDMNVWLKWPEFQHTAARRRLDVGNVMMLRGDWFQHTAARRR